MGIPYYVASLLRKHKHIQRTCTETVLEFDTLGIDFNCFIHTYLNANNPIGSIVVALENLLTNTVRAKQVYIAFDGLVPYGKMIQQRYRRMRQQSTEGFDKHQISPSTQFMLELADTIRYMFPNAIVSDTLEPGEGEHKIFQWLQTIPKKNRIQNCIYGLDADLVLISIAQRHLGQIELLREKDDGFATLNVSALVEVLPMDPDTYIRMSILSFGNDFMPSLAMFSLREEGYSRAIFYADKNTAHKDERKILMKRAKESDRRIVSTDGYVLETRLGCQLMDGVIDWEPVCYAFWKTFEWTLQYFTTSKVPDWCWYYPYPEAPLLETLDTFEQPTSFVWEYPEPNCTVKEQLQFILPEISLRKTGLEPKYPDELYDEELETRHPWMRKFAWECDPYISIPLHPLTTVNEYVLQ